MDICAWIEKLYVKPEIILEAINLGKCRRGWRYRNSEFPCNDDCKE